MSLPLPEDFSPSLSVIRERAKVVFNKTPCLWQLKIAEAFLKHDRDIVCIAGTGMGKTLSFWLPLLLRPTGIQIVITPLNQLGRQNVESLRNAGIQSIAINAETATRENFRAIENLEYRAIIVSPEQLMKPGGGFEKLLRSPDFVSHIVGFIFDEAHCIASWGEFRPEYRELHRLHYILAHRVPYMITSATLTPDTLTEIKKGLHVRTSNLVTVHTSTDRPNIYLCIRKINHTLSTYADLGFLIPEDHKDGVPSPVPPKFLIFFDDIQDSINAAKFLRNRLPPHARDKIKWFNSDMTTEFKETEVKALIAGDTWGFCTTESFGMGMDIPDICLVIQWRASCSLSTIWQRWGRAARNRDKQGMAILFAEKEYFDDV
ncbi:P-loop containing nucleoside triphosphate hydrolase protein, partial [Boletus edulis BED1]